MTAKQRTKICKGMLWIIPGTEDLRPYITAEDKKWIMETVGMALLAAILSAIMALILK